METKQCTACKQLLPLIENFRQSRKKHKTGTVTVYWNSQCNACRAKQCAGWRKRNPDKVISYYNETGKLKTMINARRYRQRHPDRASANVARYRKTPKGATLHRIESLLDYYRKKAAKGKYTPEQLQARIDYYGGLCWMCKNVADTIDHVKPITRGGTNWPANIRPACRSCNSRKGNRLPSEVFSTLVV